MQVDPVEEGAGDAVAVALDLAGKALAGAPGRAPVAALAPPRCLSAISGFGPKSLGIPVIPKLSTAWAITCGRGGSTSGSFSGKPPSGSGPTRRP